MTQAKFNKSIIKIFLTLFCHNIFASSQVPVSATITHSCAAIANPLSFGTGLLAQMGSATTNIAITCTTNTNVQFSLGIGNYYDSTNLIKRISDGNSNYLTYKIYQDSAHQTEIVSNQRYDAGNLVQGVEKAVALYGLITANQNTTTPGVYNDTLAITLIY